MLTNNRKTVPKSGKQVSSKNRNSSSCSPGPIQHSATSTTTITSLPASRLSASGNDLLYKKPCPTPGPPEETVSPCSQNTSGVAELEDIWYSNEPESVGIQFSNINHPERGSHGLDLTHNTTDLLYAALLSLDGILPLCTDQRPLSLLSSLFTRQQAVLKRFMRYETVCPVDLQVCQSDSPQEALSCDEIDAALAGLSQRLPPTLREAIGLSSQCPFLVLDTFQRVIAFFPIPNHHFMQVMEELFQVQPTKVGFGQIGALPFIMDSPPDAAVIKVLGRELGTKVLQTRNPGTGSPVRVQMTTTTGDNGIGAYLSVDLGVAKPYVCT